MKQLGEHFGLHLKAPELGESDVPGCWGGRSFSSCFLKDIDRKTAIAVVGRILDVVRTGRVSIHPQTLTVTISAGLRWASGLDAPMQKFDAVAHDVDSSLYLANNEDRNRYVVHADS